MTYSTLIKRVVFGAVSLIIAGMASAQPQIAWIDTTHNFGAIDEENGHVTYLFKYTNVGDQDLVVISTRASCGCTSAAFDRAPLAPGDTAAISVTYDPARLPGRFKKKVTVDTNTEPSRTTLYITGVVVGAKKTVMARFPHDMGPLKLAHNTALLGKARKHHSKNMFIDGYNRSTDTIAPRVVSSPSWLKVGVAPAAVAPAERMLLSFYVYPDLTPLYGVVTDTISISPDPGHSDEVYRLPVVVDIEEDFERLTADDYRLAPVARLSADKIILDKSADGKTLSSSFTINNDGTSRRLNIRRIYCTNPAVSLTYKGNKIKKHKSLTVAVTLRPDKLTGSNTPTDGIITTDITVITDDPVTPVQHVRVVADVGKQ